jgi:hypothetical protein
MGRGEILSVGALVFFFQAGSNSATILAALLVFLVLRLHLSSMVSPSFTFLLI